MRTVWYNLPANPPTLRGLYDELIESEQNHGLSQHEVRSLPYLDAWINEAVRMHPPLCIPFERLVPQGGVTICGNCHASGTVVDMSPYVVGPFASLGTSLGTMGPMMLLSFVSETTRCSRHGRSQYESDCLGALSRCGVTQRRTFEEAHINVLIRAPH